MKRYEFDDIIKKAHITEKDIAFGVAFVIASLTIPCNQRPGAVSGLKKKILKIGKTFQMKTYIKLPHYITKPVILLNCMRYIFLAALLFHIGK